MSERSETRNHPLRGLISGALTPISAKLAEANISPNQVTILGGLAGVAIRVAAAYANTHPEVAGFFPGWAQMASMGIATSLDAVDGNLARYLKSQGKVRDENLGQLIDVATDRITGTASYLLKAAVARGRGDIVGEFSAVACSICHNLPSLARAVAESRGRVVSEGTIGSYPARAALDIASSSFPTTHLPGDFLLQPTFDLTTLSVSLVTTISRFRSAFSPTIPEVLDTEDREKAKSRFGILAGLTAVSIMAAGGYLAYRFSST